MTFCTYERGSEGSSVRVTLSPELVRCHACTQLYRPSIVHPQRWKRWRQGGGFLETTRARGLQESGQAKATPGEVVSQPCYHAYITDNHTMAREAALTTEWLSRMHTALSP